MTDINRNLAKKSGKNDGDIFYFNSVNASQITPQQLILQTKCQQKNKNKLVFDFSDLNSKATVHPAYISNQNSQIISNQLPILWKNNNIPIFKDPSLENTYNCISNNTNNNKLWSKKQIKANIIQKIANSTLVQGNTSHNNVTFNKHQPPSTVSMSYQSQKVNSIENKVNRQNLLPNSYQLFYPNPMNGLLNNLSMIQQQQITNLQTSPPPTHIIPQHLETVSQQDTDNNITKIIIEAIKPQYQQLKDFNQETIEAWTQLQEECLLEINLSKKLENLGSELFQAILTQQRTIIKLQHQNQYLNQQIIQLQTCFNQLCFNNQKNTITATIFQAIEHIEKQLSTLSKDSSSQTKHELQSPTSNLSADITQHSLQQQLQIQLVYIYNILDSASSIINKISSMVHNNNE